MRADRDNCLAEWRAWARAGDPTSWENRDLAEQRILRCLNRPKSNHQLTSLHIVNLGLSSLPDRLPANLRVLDVSGHQLTRLRDNLPTGLRHLNVSSNQLNSLPRNLPEGLRALDVSRNQLTSLPAHLPASLRSLDLEFNQLTSLPESIFELSPDCLVYASNNPLTEGTRNRCPSCWRWDAACSAWISSQ
jgi:Leucine-rich repeat (LRR) protein